MYSISRLSPCTHSVIHQYVIERRQTSLVLQHGQQAYCSGPHLFMAFSLFLYFFFLNIPFSAPLLPCLPPHTHPSLYYLSLHPSFPLLLCWSTCWGIWPLSGRPVGSRHPWGRYSGTRPAGRPWSGSGSDRSEPQGSQSHGTSYTPPVGGKREHTHWTTLSNISSVYYWHSGVSGTCSM